MFTNPAYFAKLQEEVGRPIYGCCLAGGSNIWWAVCFKINIRNLWIQKTKMDSIYLFYTKINLIFMSRHKNGLDFYCIKIDPIFIAQKLTQFLLHKNRPDFYCTKNKNWSDFYCTKIDPIFIAQKSRWVYFTDRIEILRTNTFSD